MKTYIYQVITGDRKGKLANLLRWALTPLSWLYGASIALRNGLYDRELLRVRRLPCPVVSVGNITVGGAGKTPTVIWIARQLQRDGFRVGILLRGYRRKKGASVLVVSDGKEILASPQASGDEAAMLAGELPGVLVIVGKDRYAAGLAAIQIWGKPDGALILDDGFQYRRLARDIDIVTLNSAQPSGSGRLLPAGTLREPASALRRADVILMTHTDLAPAPASLRDFVDGNRIVVESRHRPTRLYRLDTGREFPLDFLRGKRVLAVCAIGNPQTFAETLRRLESAQVDLLAFPDHHRYTPKDFDLMMAQANLLHADLIVTTQKDAQKLGRCRGDLTPQPSFWNGKGEYLLPSPSRRGAGGEVHAPPIFVLSIELEVVRNRDVFLQRLKRAIAPTKKG
jgi:tetraacyldisaccharide 4'-kinase